MGFGGHIVQKKNCGIMGIVPTVESVGATSIRTVREEEDMCVVVKHHATYGLVILLINIQKGQCK